jgi:hypothetical protein
MAAVNEKTGTVPDTVNAKLKISILTSRRLGVKPTSLMRHAAMRVFESPAVVLRASTAQEAEPTKMSPKSDNATLDSFPPATVTITRVATLVPTYAGRVLGSKVNVTAGTEPSLRRKTDKNANTTQEKT